MFLTDLKVQILGNVTTQFKAKVRETRKKNLSRNSDHTFTPVITDLTSQDLEKRRKRTIKMIQMTMKAKQKNFAVETSKRPLNSNRCRLS